MFRRITLCALLLILLLGGLLSAQAQAAGWTTWLFNQADGRMIRMDASGATLDEFILPLPAGFDRYPLRAAAGRGGSPFAYVVYNSQTYQGQLVVAERDRILAGFSLPLTFSDSLELLPGEHVFNEDNSALALGYSLEGGGWALIVLDALYSSVTDTIRHDTPTVAVLGLPSGFGLTPVVRRFLGREVVFNLVQAGSEGAAEYPGYTWNLDSDNLTLNAGYPSLDSDTLPATGEVIMTLPDARLPNQSADFVFFQANSLHVFQPASGARFPFFNLPGSSLSAPRFIQNGELILTDSVDAAGRYQWLVIGRDGRLTGLLPTAAALNDVRGVPDGFVYITDSFTPGAATLVYVNTRDGLDAGVPIWTSAPGALPLIVWAGGAGAVAQAAYMPWAQLAEPVYVLGATAAATPFVTPFMTPVSPGGVSPVQVPQVTPVVVGVLAAGRLAVVNTTEGDQLNVRLGPGLGFDIIARLPNGTRVTLVEGPRNAEGYTWWKIRTVSGLEGWAVEGVSEGGTYLQTLLPA